MEQAGHEFLSNESLALVTAALLQMLHMLLFAIKANREVGVKQTLGPRDEPISLEKRTARLQRALDNHFEGLILFSIAIIITVVEAKTSPLTSILAFSYVVARAFYIPAYYFSWVPARSLIWAAGWLSTLFLLILAVT